MSNFAKAQMLKYGWTEGKGLGKNENGMLEPIRASLKSDKEGIGHKNDEGNNWWEQAYNHAVQNINVQQHENGIAIVANNDTQDDPIRNQMKKILNPSIQYTDFLKKSTLKDGHVQEQTNLQGKTLKLLDSPTVLSNEELLKACHGRTAHKGARHGLTQKGKLQRIAEQDQLLLIGKSQSILELNENSVDKKEASLIDELDDNANSVLAEQPFGKTRTQRKKEKRKIKYMINDFNSMCKLSDSNSMTEHAEQKREKMNTSIDEKGDEIDEDASNKPIESKKKTKKAKKRSRRNMNELTDQLNDSCVIIEGVLLDQSVEEISQNDEEKSKKIKLNTEIEQNNVAKKFDKTQNKINIIQDITISHPKSLNFGPLNPVEKLNYLITKKKLKNLIRKQKKRNLLSTTKEKQKPDKTDKKLKKKKKKKKIAV